MRDKQWFVITACLFSLSLFPLSAFGEYTISGNLDVSSKSWNRIKATPTDIPPSCSTPAEDSYNDNVKYARFTITPTVTGNLQAEITAGGSNIDSMLAIYCDPFDPDNPGNNLIAMDDDGNEYPHASLSTRDIPLQAGNSYHLVVSNYSNYIPYGSYQLTIGDNFKHIHTLKDSITALQVVAGIHPALSDLGSLSDLSTDNRITLAQAIMILQELAD